MTDEVPLVKPKAKNVVSLKLPPRLNSDGHFQQTDIDPEKKRNMPSIVEEKQTKEDTKLNVNAIPFEPKFLGKNKNQNESKNSNHSFQAAPPLYNNVNVMNMNMNAFYPNQNNVNISQQVGPYEYNYPRNYFNNYPNNQNQTSYQPYPSFFLNNNHYSQFPQSYNNKYPNYKKAQNQQKREPGEPYTQRQYPINDNYNIRNSMPVSQSNDITANGPKNSIGLSRLSFEAPAFIPKSRRYEQEKNNLTNNTTSNNTNMNNLANNSNTNNGEENIELNLNSPTYMPTNVELKKKEEQIQKEKETAELETPKEETKNKRNNEKEEEKDKKIEKEKKEVQIPSKMLEPKKPPTSLKDILSNPDPKIESKNSTKEKSKKSDNTEIINYPKNTNKKMKNSLNKKIDALKEKDKKIKEIEEKKQKEQERIRKIEEERRRKEAEEERQRKEEERKKKEEEKKKKEEELKKKMK